MSTEPTYRDYLKAALATPVPLPALGVVPVNWLVLGLIGVAGLLHPGLWLIGLALEVLLVFSLASNERFQNYVRGRRLVAVKQATSDAHQQATDALYASLDPASQERYDALLSRCGRIRELASGQVGDLLEPVAEEGLAELQAVYLRLLASREVVHRQVDQRLRAELEAELDEAVRRVESLGPTADARIRRSVESTVDLLRKRLDNLRSAADHVTYIDSELRRIEHQAELIVEEAALARDPEQVARHIDAVTASFSETREWMTLNRELFSELDDDPTPRPPRLTAS